MRACVRACERERDYVCVCVFLHVTEKGYACVYLCTCINILSDYMSLYTLWFAYVEVCFSSSVSHLGLYEDKCTFLYVYRRTWICACDSVHIDISVGMCAQNYEKERGRKRERVRGDVFNMHKTKDQLI